LKIGKAKTYYNSSSSSNENEFKENELTVKEFCAKLTSTSKFYLKMVWKTEALIEIN
jgi:hypothetical protein